MLIGLADSVEYGCIEMIDGRHASVSIQRIFRLSGNWPQFDGGHRRKELSGQSFIDAIQIEIPASTVDVESLLAKQEKLITELWSFHGSAGALTSIRMASLWAC